MPLRHSDQGLKEGSGWGERGRKEGQEGAQAPVPRTKEVGTDGINSGPWCCRTGGGRANGVHSVQGDGCGLCPGLVSQVSSQCPPENAVPQARRGQEDLNLHLLGLCVGPSQLGAISRALGAQGPFQDTGLRAHPEREISEQGGGGSVPSVSLPPGKSGSLLGLTTCRAELPKSNQF